MEGRSRRMRRLEKQREMALSTSPRRNNSLSTSISTTYQHPNPLLLHHPLPPRHPPFPNPSPTPNPSRNLNLQPPARSLSNDHLLPPHPPLSPVFQPNLHPNLKLQHLLLLHHHPVNGRVQPAPSTTLISSRLAKSARRDDLLGLILKGRGAAKDAG